MHHTGVHELDASRRQCSHRVDELGLDDDLGRLDDDLGRLDDDLGRLDDDLGASMTTWGGFDCDSSWRLDIASASPSTIPLRRLDIASARHFDHSLAPARHRQRGAMDGDPISDSTASCRVHSGVMPNATYRRVQKVGRPSR
jgi:hypothetical protein